MSGQEKNKSYFHMGRKGGIEMQFLSSTVPFWLFTLVDFSQLLLLIFECSGVCRDQFVFWCLFHASVCFLGAVMDSKVIVPLTIFHPQKYVSVSPCDGICLCFLFYYSLCPIPDPPFVSFCYSLSCNCHFKSGHDFLLLIMVKLQFSVST